MKIEMRTTFSQKEVEDLCIQEHIETIGCAPRGQHLEARHEGYPDKIIVETVEDEVDECAALSK